MRYAKFIFIFILIFFMNKTYSFSNYDEETKNGKIYGFFTKLKKLDDDNKYYIILDKISISSVHINTSEGDKYFWLILEQKLNTLLSTNYIPLSIEYVTPDEVDENPDYYAKVNKILIKGSDNRPSACATTATTYYSKKYAELEKGSITVFYKNLDNKKESEIARIILHEILHLFSLSHSYYENETGIAVNRVMYYNTSGLENYTDDEETGLKSAYYPLQFKHQIREENQSNYFIHDTRLLFNRDINPEDDIKDKIVDYKLYLQGNKHTPNACFKIMKKRLEESNPTLFKIDTLFEANLNYTTGSIGIPEAAISKFMMPLEDGELSVKFNLDEIEKNEGKFRLRLYHEYNEDFLHVYPDKTTRNYNNKKQTLEENANDYIDFQVADLKITEPVFNSRLQSDKISIKIFPFKENSDEQLWWYDIKKDLINYQGVKEIYYCVTVSYYDDTDTFSWDTYFFRELNIKNQFELYLYEGKPDIYSNQFKFKQNASFYIDAMCLDEKENEVGKASTVLNTIMEAKRVTTNKIINEHDNMNIYIPERKDNPTLNSESLGNVSFKWVTGEIPEKLSSMNPNYTPAKFKLVLENIFDPSIKILILEWPYDKYKIINRIDLKRIIEGGETGLPPIGEEVWDKIKKEFKSEKYKFKLILNLIKKDGSKGDEIDFLVTDFKFNLTRPITLGTISTVFKDPRNKPDDKNVYGFIAPLQEIDTLRVTVPRYDAEEEYWGGVEILKNGELDPVKIYKPKPNPELQPEYTQTDSTRTYKFVWDYSDQPEGFVTMRARYINDPLSFDQKKIKVGYANTWEDFENGMGNWETKTQYAYPTGMGEEGHYWRTTYNTSTKSNELRTSTYGFSAQRFEILSPVIEVPLAVDSVETFLYFDYAREYGEEFVSGGKSLMVMQFCDEGGTPLPFEWQPFGSMSQEDDYPITGYPLNMQNFFSPNYVNIDLFPDNLWNKMGFGLSMSDKDYSGMKIRVKFIQFYTTNFVGIIDNWSAGSVYNPISFIYNPPAYTDATIHHIDNFQVRTYYMINLPPAIDKVADQEVKQHCGWQKINLTGITNGQNAILGDNEDLEDQGKSVFKNIKRIKDVEQREDGSLKITAIVQEDKKFKEVILPKEKAKSSKFPAQKVVTIILTSDNGSLIPADSLKLDPEYVAGDTTAVLLYKPVDSQNGEANITVRVEDDGGVEHNGRDFTEMKFKINVLPFNPPVYDPPITELDNIMEDFSQIDINFDSHFIDPDPGTVDIYYKAYCDNPSMMTVTLNDNMLTVTSIENVFGTCNLTIVADDSTGTIPTVVTKTVIIADDGEDLCFSSGFASQELQLPVNFESKRIDISTQFTNELPSTPVYSVTQTNPAVVDAVFEGSELCLTSKLDVTGKTDITVNVTVDTRVISSHINVVAGNLSPEIKAEIADIETDANFKTMSINLKDHYTDPNKDWLGYSVRTTQNKVDTYISFYDDQLIIESKANESGEDSLYISIYDGEFTVRDSLKITIGTPTVQVPYLATPIEDIHTKEDFGRQEIDLNNHFADPAGTGIAYVVDFDSTKVKCTIEEGHLLVMKSVKNVHGYVPIHVSIDDGVQKIKDPNFKDCDPKNVVRIKEKIKKNHEIN